MYLAKNPTMQAIRRNPSLLNKIIPPDFGNRFLKYYGASLSANQILLNGQSCFTAPGIDFVKNPKRLGLL